MTAQTMQPHSLCIAIADKLRERIANYNLPYLALPSSTSEDVVLDVFVNMNTNGKPLSQYDIIAAQLESKLEG